MIKQSYTIIGVMSGTSLDGVDLAHIKINIQNGQYKYEIKEATTVPYNNEWMEKLKNAVGYTELQLQQLDKEYTVLLSQIIRGFVKGNSLKNIDAVCSHGHTILHQPAKRLTLQIGNLPEIAELAGQRVVCNFRVQDVKMGGQGAPLVPIGDKLLFADYYFCLNLGGFSNISFNGGKDRRLAFDICAVNTVLNIYANKLGHEYDDRGTIARSGKVDKAMYDELNDLLYYKLPFPKSLGFEYVKETLLPLIENYNISVQDKLATYTEHIAFQLAYSMRYYNPSGSLLVTGGGAYNSFLLERLQQFLPELKIVVPDDKTIQYKEALIFGLLGVLRLRGEVNVLSSVTGAPADHCAGFIYHAI